VSVIPDAAHAANVYPLDGDAVTVTDVPGAKFPPPETVPPVPAVAVTAYVPAGGGVAPLEKFAVSVSFAVTIYVVAALEALP